MYNRLLCFSFLYDLAALMQSCQNISSFWQSFCLEGKDIDSTVVFLYH